MIFFIKRKIFFSILLLFVFIFNINTSFAASNIDPGDLGHKNAKISLDNSLVNFKCLNCNVEVTDENVTGFAWSENFGWINMSPTNGGVENDGEGQLSGYAWGENTGWINFDPLNGGVSIDTSNGYFSGYAWGENTGWINFDCSNTENSCVETSWRPATTDEPDTNGGSGGGRKKACEDGKDNDQDGFIDYPNDLGCENYNDDDEIFVGCLDPDADNFNIQANFHNEPLCEYLPISGCVDVSAINFNPLASVQLNESCIYAGCTNSSALNYNEQADINDGSCIFPTIEVNEGDIPGCTDSSATNFNPGANKDDSLCLYPPLPIFGCTSPSAINFNPNADSDNGSCDLPPIKKDPVQKPPKNNISDAFKHPKTNLGILAFFLFLVGNGSALRNLFASPLRLINSIPFLIRIKKNPWGTVYDSVTKQPLDPAYVEIKSINGQISKSSITDIDGRYAFLIDSGIYKITANKKDYVFPSAKLFGKKYDLIYKNLYFGEEISHEKNHELITKDIPLDPINFNWNEFYKSQNKKIFKFHKKSQIFLAKISNTVFYMGFSFSVYSFYFFRNNFNTIILIAYLFFIGLSFTKFAPKKPGFIELKNGTTASFFLLKVFSSSLNKEIAHYITNSYGKYIILIPNGKYYMTIEKRIGEDKYELIHTTTIFKVSNGHINKIIKI